MSVIPKNYVWIIATLIIVFGIIYFLNEDDDITEGNSIYKDLYAEKVITHGHGLAVDIKDSSKLYIPTHHGLLLLLNDKELYRVGKSKDDFMGFSLHPTNSSIFFSSGHFNSGGNIGFQKSESGGVTWTKISNGVNGPVDFHALSVSPVNPNLIYGWYQGNLQRSFDQGKSWEIVNNSVLAVQFAADSKDENKVYAATPKGDGIMVSIDKGVTFNSISSKLEGAGVSSVAVHPIDSKIMLTYSEKLSGLGKSVDSGKTWRKINETFDGETVLHIAFDKNNPSIIYILTHKNKLYKSSDTGEKWLQIR